MGPRSGGRRGDGESQSGRFGETGNRKSKTGNGRLETGNSNRGWSNFTFRSPVSDFPFRESGFRSRYRSGFVRGAWVAFRAAGAAGGDGGNRGGGARGIPAVD